MKIDYDTLLNMIDELRYNINDGINIPNCHNRFSQDTYEGADGALKMLIQRLEKKYGKVEVCK